MLLLIKKKNYANKNDSKVLSCYYLILYNYPYTIILVIPIFSHDKITRNIKITLITIVIIMIILLNYILLHVDIIRKYC